MKDFIQVFKKWKDFSGRSRRREYWMFVLYVCIFAIVAGLIDGILFGSTGLFSLLLCLAVIVPSIAVGVRRLHDIGKSGYWYFINFIPLIGGLWFLFLSVQDSQPGTNKYGPNPKEA